MLASVALHGQHLLILSLAWSPHGYTYAALIDLAKQCVVLKKLCVEAGHPMITEGVQGFWNILEFSAD